MLRRYSSRIGGNPLSYADSAVLLQNPTRCGVRQYFTTSIVFAPKSKKQRNASATSNTTTTAKTNVAAPPPPAVAVATTSAPTSTPSTVEDYIIGRAHYDLPMGYLAERSPTSRSKCALCMKTIEEKEIRLGALVPSSSGDFPVPRWHHAGCFPFLARRYPATFCAANVKGLVELLDNDADYHKVVQGCELPIIDVDPALKAAATALIAARNAIQKADLSTDQIRTLLIANGYEFKSRPPDRARCIDMLSDSFAFGKTAPCASCGTGTLNYSQSYYKCSGYIDEFTRCDAKVDDIPMRGSFNLLATPTGSAPKGITYCPLQTKQIAIIEAACKGVKSPSHRPLFVAPAVAKSDTLNSSLKATLPQRVTDVDLEVLKETSAPQEPQRDRCFDGLRVGLFPSDVDFDRCLAILRKGGCTTVYSLEASSKSSGLPPPPSDYGKQLLDIAISTTPPSTPSVLNGSICLHPAYLDGCEQMGYLISVGSITEKCLIANPPPSWKAPTADERTKTRMAAQKRATDESEGLAQRKVVVKDGIAVDAYFDEAERYHVRIPDARKKDSALTVMLSRADLNSGKNAFYTLQLLETDATAGTTNYVLFRRWGRVGDANQMDVKTEKFSSLFSAESAFKRLFFDRTENQWEDRHKFVQQPGKYAMIDLGHDSAPPADPSPTKSSAAQVAVASNLPDKTQYLISKLFDVKAIQESLMEMEIDVKKMPLGNITKATIDKGFGILRELQTLLEPTHTTPSTPNTKPKMKNVPKIIPPPGSPVTVAVDTPIVLPPEIQRKVLGLSNRFYSFIPHAMSRTDMKKALIDNNDKLATKVQLLTDLTQVAETAKLMSREVSPSADPMMSYYTKLNSEMELIPETDARFKAIERYITETQGRTHSIRGKIKTLWALKRQKEEDRYSKWGSNGNRMLLWHGSRFTNWVGILSQGLRIAPPEAPSTGYMFGKGIYFADMFSKSANYCFMKHNGEGLMALTEVAVGKSIERTRSDYITSLPDGILSCYARGDMTPKSFEVNDDLGKGIIVPRGPTTDYGKSSSLLYNEIIVYDESQTTIRYLMLMDFKV